MKPAVLLRHQPVHINHRIFSRLFDAYVKRGFNLLAAHNQKQLEPHVDLINVANDADYAHVMQATYLKDNLDMYKAAKRKPDNPYLISIAKLSDLDAMISETQKELEEVKGKAQKSCIGRH